MVVYLNLSDAFIISSAQAFSANATLPGIRIICFIGKRSAFVSLGGIALGKSVNCKRFNVQKS